MILIASADELAQASMNVTGFGHALTTATGDPSPGLYNNSDVIISQHHGLRNIYSFGMYSVCAYAIDQERTQVACSNTSFAHPFTAFDVFQSEIPANYSSQATFFVTNSDGVDTFINSQTFKLYARFSFYFIFLATIATAAVLIL